MATERIELEVGDRVVKISNPDRVYFSARGETKLDLAHYYLSVADGIVNALYHRPCMLHRFPDGVDGEKVHQKRLPHGAPPWIETVRVHFPRFNRDADELCVTHPADVIWAVQMSTVEFHPWNSRRDDVESPDEWRIDLDPMPVARLRRRAAGGGDRAGAAGRAGGGRLPQDLRRQGSARVRPDRAGARAPRCPPGRLGVRPRGRAPGRRAGRPDLVAQGPRPGSVFVDYNQNARDHTIACAYSVRGTPLGQVSAPLRWDEVADADPRDFTIATMPARFAETGDLHADIDDHPYRLDTLLEWADRDERDDRPSPPTTDRLRERRGAASRSGGPRSGRWGSRTTRPRRSPRRRR